MFPLSALAGFGSGAWGQPQQQAWNTMGVLPAGRALQAQLQARGMGPPNNWGPAIQGFGAAGQQLLQGGTGALPQAPQPMDPNAPPPDPNAAADPAAVAQLQQQQGQMGAAAPPPSYGSPTGYLGGNPNWAPAPYDPVTAANEQARLASEAQGWGWGRQIGQPWPPQLAYSPQAMSPLSMLGWPGAYGGGFVGGGRRFWF